MSKREQRARQRHERLEVLDYPRTHEARDCHLCGGTGWTDSSAEIRADRGDPNPDDTTCVACDGTGTEPAHVRGTE
jgi:DnaJ-class molecular chaperone